MGMKIKSLLVNNFMIFNNLNIDLAPNINIISGENSTGKTALIKLMYSNLKGYSEAYTSKGNTTRDDLEKAIVNKYQGVFRPDNESIGRLVNRKPGNNNADILLTFSNNEEIMIGFSRKSSRHIEILKGNSADVGKLSPIYIPPKEIISTTENFGALYDSYHIAFEETYYDLTRLLEKPLRKGPNTSEQNEVMASFEKIVNGNIVQRDKKFYLKVKGAGEFEMGLVSEGYRKLTTIMYLILSGSLTKDSILFWDEPETNMNPKMIKPMVDALVTLANMGVQIFITTHDYFVQQCFNMEALYGKNKKLKYKFISLYHLENGEIKVETADELGKIENNAIMEEFDNLYDREQRMMDES